MSDFKDKVFQKLSENRNLRAHDPYYHATYHYTVKGDGRKTIHDKQFSAPRKDTTPEEFVKKIHDHMKEHAPHTDPHPSYRLQAGSVQSGPFDNYGFSKRHAGHIVNYTYTKKGETHRRHGSTQVNVNSPKEAEDHVHKKLKANKDIDKVHSVFQSGTGHG